MNKKPIIGLLFAALFLSACGMAEADVQATVLVAEANAVNTVHAQYTQIALLTPSPTNTLPATATPAITNTPEITATTGGVVATTTGNDGCDVMTFVADVTVSDGEEIAAGTPFTKTWQIKNDGTCEWTTTYTLVYSSGEQMGGPTSQPLAVAVAAGATADISVQLTAPATAGEYTGWWAIANPAGSPFGFMSVVITIP
ncbi:MAG: NBR1-Ig-like domain-containing protein [Anaerolineales bacterium]